MSQNPTQHADVSARRGAFSGRSAFIFAAIGSAVGLGNIWRFPAVAYANGGGAFILPYLVALLTAGIPLLFVDYAIGHRWRGAAPLAWRRLKRWTEFIGWWQVLICIIIALYYALIIAWALNYTIFSVDKRWGDDPQTFFIAEYTRAQTGADVVFGFDYVPAILLTIVLVWVATIAVMALGVQQGIAKLSMIFIPVLVLMFLILTVRALMLPGALEGLDAFFQPNWAALLDGSVWVAAYGQIFFSLSVAFGIMLTYSSYLKKKTDLTSSGLVVGFANSSFEILAGIAVFSALGFMAQAQGVEVSEVVTSGIGLAFFAFPTIIGEASGGSVIGVLFFVSLVLAGFTSLVSIVEVVISAFQDKFGLGRLSATLGVGIPLAVVSIVLFPTTMGLALLDVLDNWVNNYGIVVVAMVSVVILAYVVRGLPTLRDHLNFRGGFKVGRIWIACVAVVAPLALAVALFQSTLGLLTSDTTYEGYPSGFILTFGWLMAAGLLVGAVVLSFLPWPQRSHLNQLDSDGDPIAPEVVPGRGLAPVDPEIAAPDGGPAASGKRAPSDTPHSLR